MCRSAISFHLCVINFVTHRLKIRLGKASALFVLLFSVSAAAQTLGNRSLPRVGTIKDYPATGLMTGCGNLYFHKAALVRPLNPDADYVFLSRGDGSHAWMNLNGRDVLLKQIKSRARGGRKIRPFIYRYRDVQITVVTEPSERDTDDMYKMKITLRRGRAVRVVHAVGSADC
jgi:hypothetical protein